MSVTEGALVVPEEAVVPQGSKQVVFRLEKEGEGDGAKNISRRTEVQLGLRRGAMVQVLEGLKEGDTVVVAGQQRLQRDGTAVRVVDMNKAASPRNGAGNGGGGAKGGEQGSGSAPAKPAAPAANAG